MYGADFSIVVMYLPAYVLYWMVITAVFCYFTANLKRRAFDIPMQKLCHATRQVAQGDFSAYVETDHTLEKMDYIDTMFQDFNKMVEALGSLESLKSGFIANVSHEFKTPLAVIDSYATALEKDDLSPELKREYIETIRASTQKLSTLVTNILKLNKIENQVIQLNDQSFDLSRQLSECILANERKLEEKNIALSVEIYDRFIFRSDPSMLEIVWQNLLSNAIKFTEPGGQVAITQKMEADSVIVSVTDTGCGMDEYTQQHLFDKFYQGKTNQEKEGNGLGMALAQKIISLLGGTIAVGSAPGEGSTFTVTLKVEV